MVDSHSHILPGVDDGSKNMEQTIQMLQIAYKEGIDCIIATPHYKVNHQNPDMEELMGKLLLVRDEAKKINEKFDIKLGNEIYYSNTIFEHLNEGKALTLADTRYVLVEFSTTESYQNIKQGLHQLLMNGYLPILAHVERYECLYQNYEGIYKMIGMGAYMQMNISSITGKLLSKRTRFCRKLIRYGLIHLLATDAHSDSERSPTMRKGINILQKKIKKPAVNRILLENPAKLLENKYI
jgi:protein-tyrosine phosphatase